jgi:4-carboxymuconolactone decarboxylase
LGDDPQERKEKEIVMMHVTDAALAYHERMLPGSLPPLSETDPEFVERFENFAFDEVVSQGQLDDRTRFMAILATLLGCQGLEEYQVILPAALNMGVTPVEAKEIVYQAVAYLGIGRVYPFLKATNAILEDRGVSLPLAGQADTTVDDRLEKGAQAQVDIFGEGMKDFWKSGPELTQHINRWLADNCFGDYYTRRGLDYKQREMITFCFLFAQGGCESQLLSHAKANLKVGNDKEFLVEVVSQCLPYIGYPRSLNAIRCVNEAAGEN